MSYLNRNWPDGNTSLLTLPEKLTTRLPDGALAIAAAIGLSLLTAIHLLAPYYWKATSGIVAITAWAIWAILRRSTITPAWLEKSLRTVVAFVTIAAVLATIAIATYGIISFLEL